MQRRTNPGQMNRKKKYCWLMITSLTKQFNKHWEVTHKIFIWQLFFSCCSIIATQTTLLHIFNCWSQIKDNKAVVRFGWLCSAKIEGRYFSSPCLLRLVDLDFVTWRNIYWLQNGSAWPHDLKGTISSESVCSSCVHNIT